MRTFIMVDILSFIQEVEKAHFRTRYDTGANLNALLIWNILRRKAGLPELKLEDLPAQCATHDELHIIRPDYGCKERKPVKPIDAAEQRFKKYFNDGHHDFWS